MAAKDTLEVVMLVDISGERYTDTGKIDTNGRAIHEHHPWPRRGQKLSLPRQIALDMIDQGDAYPTTGKPVDRRGEAIAAAIASQDA